MDLSIAVFRVTLITLSFCVCLCLLGLDIAIASGSPALVKSVLCLRASPDNFSFFGVQSLSENSFRDVLKCLVDAKADVNAGRQMLHRVDFQSPKSANVVACLIQHGAQLNTFNRASETPLIRAVKAGAEDSVRLLLAAKANPSLDPPSFLYCFLSHSKTICCGGTPLDFACNARASESMLTTLFLAGAESAACHKCRKRNGRHRLFHRIAFLRDPEFPPCLPPCLVAVIQGYKVDIKK